MSAQPTPEPTVTVLSEDECWEFLADRPLGRLATAVSGYPEIFPVTFAVADHRVYFMTRAGSKLVELTVNARVAFEADEWSPSAATSVVVKGVAQELETDADLAAAHATDLHSFHDDKDVWVRIVPTEVSGRRLER